MDTDCDPGTWCLTVTSATDDKTVQIQPYPGVTDPATFYQYNHPYVASANTGLEISNKSQLFVYEAPDQRLYLFIIHDRYEDGEGGTCEMAVLGMIGAGQVVADDPGEGCGITTSSGNGTCSWQWWSCCTDGALLGPLFCQQNSFSVKYTAQSGMNGVVVRSGKSDLLQYPLTLNTPITFALEGGVVPCQ